MSYAIFPVLQGVNWGLAKRPNWNTATHKTAAGNEYRTGFRQYPITEFDLSYSYMSLNDKLTMEGFFNQQNGALTPFYFDAQNDDTVSGFGVGTGDGTTTTFTIYKSAGTGAVEPVQGFNGFNLYKSDWQGNQLQYSTPRTNLANYSITPGVSGDWQSSGLTLSSATSVIPGGTAGKVTGNGTFSSFEPGPAVTCAGKYTWSVIIENVSEVSTLLGIYDSTSSQSVSYYSYTWGTQTTAFVNGYASDHSVSVQQLGTGPNGGALIKFSVSGTGTIGDSIQGYIYPDNQSNTTNALIVHGCQFETGGVATSIIATTTSPGTVTDYSLSGDQVTFSTAPKSGATITWSGGYYYLVRFDGDTLDFNQFANLMYELQECKLVVVR